MSQKLAKLLAAERAEEPKKAEMHDEVIDALREPLCSGVIPWGALTLSGSIEEGPAAFWQGERAIPAFDTEKATLGRELQTPIGRVLARAVTGRVLFKRAEAEAWLASLNATPTTIAAETRAKEWFRADVKRGEKRYTRPGYCDEMVRQFGISKRGATRIWDAEAPDPWKNPGRRKRTESPQKLSH